MLNNLFRKRDIIILVNCVNRLLNIKLRSRYDMLLLCYFNYLFFFKCFLVSYRMYHFRNNIFFSLSNVMSNKLVYYYRNKQYNLLDIFYEKLNYFSVLYNISRKRKQRRSLYVVLAFEKHVCFKNIEREYEQIRLVYSKW